MKRNFVKNCHKSSTLNNSFYISLKIIISQSRPIGGPVQKISAFYLRSAIFLKSYANYSTSLSISYTILKRFLLTTVKSAVYSSQNLNTNNLKLNKMKTSNEINKTLSTVKDQSEVLFVSKENPEYFFNIKYSNDGERLLNVSAYESSSKAKFYAAKGNIHTYNNGEVL